jgi:pyruvate kinase
VVIRRAKIVCTIGPASDSPEMLDALLGAGMDVARLNFSHGTHEEHAERLARIRSAAERRGQEVAILQDLCGPKIRCGKFPNGAPELMQDAVVRLYAADEALEAPERGIPIQYASLSDDLVPGDVILMDDGKIAMEVDRIDKHAEQPAVVAKVTQPGKLRDKVGVHLPAERVRIATLTDKDKRDLSFGLGLGVDYVALSFVRNASEVQLVKDICDAWGRPTPVVSKIETPQAVQHLEPIIVASDAVMVARGDLGVEFSPEQVPVIQREILGLARRHGRPAIVATEMMQSMMTATRPTRAEASDVATAVFGGADGVMLSGETAMGAHPALVVRTMHRIVVEAEQSPFYTGSTPVERDLTVAEAVAHGACHIASQVGAKVIVAFTEAGRSAAFVSQARPRMPIIGLSPNSSTLRKLRMMWGVIPHYVEPLSDSDQMIERAHALLLANGIVSPGDRFVTIFGAPVGVSGSTNALQVKVVE